MDDNFLVTLARNPMTYAVLLLISAVAFGLAYLSAQAGNKEQELDRWEAEDRGDLDV